MKTLLLTSIALLTSLLPITAQAQTSPSGPLARSANREIVRLAAVADTAAVGSGAELGDKSAPLDWSNVAKLKPATEIVVAVEGKQPARRYVVWANETQLTVLNLDEPPVDPKVRGLLLQLAPRGREYLNSSNKTAVMVTDHVRVGFGGVFVDDRKVADLDHIVENIARDRVTVISARVKRGGSPTRAALLGVAGLIGGGAVGFAAGGVSGGMYAAGFGASLGMPVGMVVGGIAGYRSGGRHVQEVIYRAP